MSEGQKGPPTTYAKKPKLTKAEMRAKQEQQRAAKAAKKGETQPQQQKKLPQTQKPAPAKKGSTIRTKTDPKQVDLFSHLQQFNEAPTAKPQDQIHPEILKLGLKYADGSISGSNARCIALLTAFKSVIKDYTTPPSKSLDRDLEVHIKPLISYLISCRPMSISMGNAIRFLKTQIHKTGQMTEQKAKKYLNEEIDGYIQERILAADELIVEKGNSKIVDGDVILTYACSTSVEMILRAAHDQQKKFRVVIVDSRPGLEGKGLLRRLSGYGIECCYVMYNGLSFIMTEVSKVFLGAFSMLSNGNVISRVGTAGVAMMANRFNIPVMICCETYKFVERAQLDGICFNELGDPNTLATSELLKNWKDIDNLKLLNLNLDLTPAEFVTMVITEVGMIPPTSVPVIVREQNTIDANG